MDFVSKLPEIDKRYNFIFVMLTYFSNFILCFKTSNVNVVDLFFKW
uniref:Uncharacterized protein n=1 Tax=Rhizophora mucronata TaxID=61149 RepID=A0A2P2J699_RHIMU